MILVLMLWMAAIGLFFHRWGKIRMLEPYTPKFEEDIRPMCPLPSMDPIVVGKRMSMCPLTSIQCGPSWNPNGIGVGRGERRNNVQIVPSRLFQLTASASLPVVYSPYSRPRLNSVFVGPHLFSPPQPPRKTKSAVDIHSLLLEAECEV